MARTLKEIEQSIITGLTSRSVQLSPSKVAEWRVWTSVIAGVIYAFELVMDVFMRTIETHSNIVRPGTADWYAVMMRKYQWGHELKTNPNTYEVYYDVNDTDACIVKHVAVKELDSYLLIKVATHDEQDKVVPLTIEQTKGVKAYIESVKFVGTKVRIVSQEADSIRYHITAYCRDDADPVVVSDSIRASLEAYKSQLAFDAKLYRTKLLDSILGTSTVITADITSIERKSYDQSTFMPLGLVDTMDAGYFEYTDDSVLTVKRINELDDEN